MIPLGVLRVLEHVHGHLGWLAVAALLHPAILLRRPARRAPLAVLLATALAVVAGALGAAIYTDYKLRLRQALFVASPALGWCFERKEHLAVGAVAFALVGCVAHLAAPAADESLRDLVARTAHRAYVAAFVLALVAATLGVAVASSSSF